MTLTPAAWNFSKYGTGFPAPNVTNAGFSSQITSTISSLFGAISMTLTPNGRFVSVRQRRISSRVYSVVRPPVEMIPAPPAFETAAARFASEIHAIPPCRMGTSMPNSSFNRFATINTSIDYHICSFYVLKCALCRRWHRQTFPHLNL